MRGLSIRAIVGRLIVGFSMGFMVLPAIANDKYVKGEGRFYSTDEDSVAFVKRQLLFNAFQNVIGRELRELNLDSKLFWNRFDEKFEAHFVGVEENFKKEFGMTEEQLSELSGRKRAKREADYKRLLRIKKLNSKSNFGRISHAIRSYSIKQISRSTRFPNSRYISILAKVDRKWINRIYYKFTHEGEKRYFSKLYLTVDIDIKDMTWEDVGVDLANNFSDVLKEHWKKWLEEHLREHVEKIIISGPEIQNRLRNYWKLPAGTSQSMNLISVIETARDTIEESKFKKDVVFYKDSLWLRVKVEMAKKEDKALLKLRTFKFSGEYTLIDLKTNLLVDYFDFSEETHEYSYKNARQLGTNVASLVYRLPLERFRNLGKKFQNLFSKFNRTVITVSNTRSIQDLFHINRLLMKKGLTLQLGAVIKTYDGHNANIQVDYHGSEMKLKKLLESLNGRIITEDRMVYCDINQRPYMINIKDSVETDKKLEGMVNEKSN